MVKFFSQVEFNSTVWVTGVITKGRDAMSQMVTSYDVSHSLNGGTWSRVRNSDSGNVEVWLFSSSEFLISH